jgi:D-3-phosphoglycerate dehydrogenase
MSRDLADAKSLLFLAIKINGGMIMYKWKVVVTAVTFAKADPEPLQRLQAIGCEVITNSLGRPLTEGEMINAAQDADALIVGNDKVTGKIIRSCPRLKVIAKHGVGVDGIDRKTAAECGVVVTNAPGVNSHEVADLTFGLLHMLSRGLYIANEATKSGHWLKPMGVGLWGKTIGIVGVGKIGLATAYRATGYKMKILGFDCVKRPEANEIGLDYVALDQLLQQSDFVSLHLPLTNETRNILDDGRLGLLKPGAILINTARSQLVEYETLYKALLDGRIRGYGVDVYDFEPPQLHPMFSLENVILTPHLGGTCKESNIRMGNTAVSNVIAVLEKRTPPNLTAIKVNLC